MTKEEVKQWLRNQINSCIKAQHEYNDDIFELCYNKSYLRALKLSTITGQPVNKNNFTGGETLFWFDTKYKMFWYCDKIDDYLDENSSKDYSEYKKILEEVFKEYDQYKAYNVYS